MVIKSNQLMAELNEEIDALLGVRRQLEVVISDKGGSKETRKKNQGVILKQFEAQLRTVKLKARVFGRALRRGLNGNAN